MADDNDARQRVRLDRWLWAARFFKTRALATEAIRGGHVQFEQQRVKAAKPVNIGDRLTIRKGEVSFEVVVLALSERRGSATVAATLYEETAESRAEREHQQALRRERRAMGLEPAAGEGRPDKRQRRQLHRFRQSPPDD